MLKSFKITKEIRSEMVEYFSGYSVSPPKYASHAFKTNNMSVVIYDSLKVVFNGNFTQESVDMWLDKTSYYEANIVGSDEVGTGDFFGPIIVVSAYVSLNDVSKLKAMQIMDSKNLSDANIVLIAKELVKFIDYKVVCCDNEMYNDLYDKGYNIKQILAFLHHKAIKLLDKDCICIVDQFVEKKTFEKYINQSVNYKFMTKAESEASAVAVASIIARAYFIKKMDELENEINSLTTNKYKIPYGAGSVCDDVARKIMNEISEDTLKKFVKYNFKNVEKIGGKKNGR